MRPLISRKGTVSCVFISEKTLPRWSCRQARGWERWTLITVVPKCLRACAFIEIGIAISTTSRHSKEFLSEVTSNPCDNPWPNQRKDYRTCPFRAAQNMPHDAINTQIMMTNLHFVQPPMLKRYEKKCILISQTALTYLGLLSHLNKRATLSGIFLADASWFHEAQFSLSCSLPSHTMSTWFRPEFSRPQSNANVTLMRNIIAKLCLSPVN